jgi:hypothetical protein
VIVDATFDAAVVVVVGAMVDVDVVVEVVVG